MALKMKIMMALLATSSRALRPTGTRMMKVTKGSRMLQREGKFWTPSALAEACNFGCPACGGDGCGVCGGGLLGAQKQQAKAVSLEVPVHASAYCGCGGLGCEMCGGGMLLAAAPTRAAVHA